MPLHGIKLVTFDATNTFLKFRVPPWEYYATIASNYGFKGNGNDIKPRILQGFKEMNKLHPNFGKDTIFWEQWWTMIVERAFQCDLDKENILKISLKLIEDYKTAKCWEVAQGTEDLLEYLKNYGINVGVISNFDPRLHNVLNNLKLRSFFEFVLTSYDVGISKPDKKIFKLAEEKCKTNISASQCLHIGDDIKNDYEGAMNAGWHALLLTDEPIKSQNPLCTFSNLKDIHSAFKTSDLHFQ